MAGHFLLGKHQCPNSLSESTKMENVPYSNVIGSVMYSMISTRPDLSFAIFLLNRFMSNPGHEHWKALQWVLNYINGTLNACLVYKCRFDTPDLVRYVDSYFTGDRDSLKSTMMYFYML